LLKEANYCILTYNRPEKYLPFKVEKHNDEFDTARRGYSSDGYLFPIGRSAMGADRWAFRGTNMGAYRERQYYLCLMQ
jgi:hypothetical protein